MLRTEIEGRYGSPGRGCIKVLLGLLGETIDVGSKLGIDAKHYLAEGNQTSYYSPKKRFQRYSKQCFVDFNF